jgi:sugar phosphate isomerase/epimerase
MKIGFMSNGAHEDVDFAVQHGFASLELSFFHGPMDPKIEVGPALKEKMEAAGLPVCAVGVWGRNYLAADDAERKQAWQELARAMDYAQAMGSPILVMGAGEDKDKTLAEKMEAFLPNFTKTCEQARKRNLQVAIYNCGWANFVTGPEAWQALFDALPDAPIGIKFDPSHPYHAKQDYLRHLRDFGARVLHAHAKDVQYIAGEPFTEPPAGLGDIRWGNMISILYHHGYEGTISLEPHSKPWTEALRYTGLLIAKRHLDAFLPVP